MQNKRRFMKVAISLCVLASIVVIADEVRPTMMGEVTPSAGPHVTDWSDFYVTGEFIWWNPKQEGISYASGGRNTGTLTNFKGHREYVSSKYRSGFKMG